MHVRAVCHMLNLCVCVCVCCCNCFVCLLAVVVLAAAAILFISSAGWVGGWQMEGEAGMRALLQAIRLDPTHPHWDAKLEEILDESGWGGRCKCESAEGGVDEGIWVCRYVCM